MMRHALWVVGIASCGVPWVIACGSPPPAQSAPPPPTPVLSNCVLHAGEAATASRTDVTPEGQDTVNIESVCSYNAECVAEQGVETPGDGFVELECRADGECSCRVEPSAPASSAVTFSFRASCQTLEESERLMLDHCLKGMGLADAEP